MRVRQTEEQLGEVLVEWLSELKLRVHQEVQLKNGGPRCDVVAVRNERWIWAIEMKMRFGLDVLAQAEHWLRMGYAHRSSIAVPVSTHTDGARLGFEVAKSLGIGILQVCGSSVTEVVAPRFLRAPRSGVMLQRLEGDADRAVLAKAGTNRGGYWTPFRETCRQLGDYVRAHEGTSLKDAIDGIRHHYASTASARAHLSQWVEAGHIEGVVLVRDGRKLTLRSKTPVGGTAL